MKCAIDILVFTFLDWMDKSKLDASSFVADIVHFDVIQAINDVTLLLEP